jgi:hypothetical protein
VGLRSNANFRIADRQNVNFQIADRQNLTFDLPTTKFVYFQTPKKLAKILPFFGSLLLVFAKKISYHCISRKTLNFRRKLAKIAESFDHNIDPRCPIPAAVLRLPRRLSPPPRSATTSRPFSTSFSGKRFDPEITYLHMYVNTHQEPILRLRNLQLQRRRCGA